MNLGQSMVNANSINLWRDPPPLHPVKAFQSFKIAIFLRIQNGEFQVYTPETANLYTANGYLYLKPVSIMLLFCEFVFKLAPLYISELKTIHTLIFNYYEVKLFL